MNLLENNAEFKSVTLKFADRMQKLLNIDVQCVLPSATGAFWVGTPGADHDNSSGLSSAGKLPSPTQMFSVAQDEELRQYSMQWVASAALSVPTRGEHLLRSAPQNRKGPPRLGDQSVRGHAEASLEYVISEAGRIIEAMHGSSRRAVHRRLQC